jgi:Spy/CpxP family protein refolding chaperone
MTRKPGFVAAALLLLTFLVGGFAGMALEEAAGLDWFDFLDEDNPTASEGSLLSGLQLTAEQQERVEDILDEQEDRLEDYWESRIPDMERIVAASYEQIRTLLTPAQRETFDARIRAQGIPVPRAPD